MAFVSFEGVGGGGRSVGGCQWKEDTEKKYKDTRFILINTTK